MPEASTLEELNPFTDEMTELRDEVNDRLRLYNDYHRDAEGIPGIGVYLGDNGFSVEDRVITVTANTTLDGTHKYVLVNISSSDITITLPAVVDHKGRDYWIKNIGTITNNIIIDADGTELINDEETLTIVTAAHVLCDGAAWYTLP